MNFNLNDTILILRRTPEILDMLLSGLPDAWTSTNEGPDTWSPFDIIGHLIHGEKTDWIPRARIILSDAENKVFEPFDMFAHFEDSKGKTLKELLSTFKSMRMENIRQLEQLDIDDDKLALTGVHPALGIVTLKQLLATWAVHDLSHLNQIARVMMKNYKSEVGPWKQYVSLFH